MNRLYLLSCLAAAVPLLHAAEVEPGPPAQVNVHATRADETGQRRNATAAKMVFGREELDRNGDSNVGEILKRLPGVTMGGAPGRGGGGVRMRGMGNGYTQVLLNGERPPAGFSPESLAPDQVERIEIMRGPVAEHSTQAIAGTINIVLREGYQQKDVQLKVSDSMEAGRHSPGVSLTMPGKRGAFTWLLNGSLSDNRRRDAATTLTEASDTNGALTRAQTLDSHSESNVRGLHLTPRLSYRFDNGDSVNFQPFVFSNRGYERTRSTLTQGAGAVPAEYAQAQTNASSAADFMRGFGNWQHKIDAAAKLDVKFGLGFGRSRNDALRTEVGGPKPQSLLIDRDSAHTSGGTLGGKYMRSLGQGHQLAAGWDAEAMRRELATLALRDGVARPGAPARQQDASTRRLAAYVQDEWDITPQWGVYLGLRWEGIRTHAAAGDGDPIENTSAVWSPVLHTVWRIPGHAKDQLRASLTQSYRAPQVNDLVAAPSFSEPNSATRPDRRGNPALKPELAQGIDLAYEHYVGKSGIVSVSGFVRQIDELMRRSLSTYATPDGPRYLSTPSNVGRARSSGVELEAKMQLADLMADAPHMDLRANLSRYWSSVEGIAGPDNRIDGQAKMTANLGLDYRLKQVPLSVGGSYNWTPAQWVQVSPGERVSTGAKRQFDAYGLWKCNPSTQVRVGATNLRNDDYLTGRVVATGAGLERASTTARTTTTWSARLELKL